MNTPVVDDARWRVVVYMNHGYKITYMVGTKYMAHEQARMALQRGVYVDDERGVRTYYPPSVVDKAKVVPPGVELEKTEVTVG